MDAKDWNKLVDHPLQSWEWGEFRESTGLKVVREGNIQITIHPIPRTPWNIGYCPKGPMPDREQARVLVKVAKDNNCIFIKVEPKIEVTQLHSDTVTLQKLGFVEGRPLFTKHNFVLDVTPSETELLASFKQKTRYNIKVAEKKGVVVKLSDDPADFEKYLKLTEETTQRQGFYAHGPRYHSMMWSVLGNSQITNDKFSNQNYFTHSPRTSL